VLLLGLGLGVLAVACAGDVDPAQAFGHGDYERSYTAYLARAEEGDAAAGNLVGIHYYLGVGVERDFAEAARWFTRAARAGDANGQRNLGMMHLRGLGVAQDYQRAYGWLYLAHEGGNPSARRFLHLMSEHITPNAGMQARQRIAAEMRQAAP